MKKLLYSMMFLSLGFFLTSCDETTTDPDPVGTTGNVVLTSTPAGASIFKDSTATGKVTPDTIKNVAAGTATFTLKLTDYKDTTFTVNVTANATVSKAVTMTATPLVLAEFNDIQLFKRTATGFSAVVLLTGERISSTSNSSDLFYELTDIQSAHLRVATNTRYTDFYNGVTATDLQDGVDAPAYSSSSGAWSYTKPISQNNYSFLYTQDLNYVKLKITATGGGTSTTDPDEWIKISYIINKTPRDKRF